jgi:uncharacterized membrane protein
MNIFKRGEVGRLLPPNRIETLVDGVFAIVMTLMVFQFSVPVVEVKAELPGELLELLPRFYSYVLSFVVLAMFWTGHHSAFHYIKRSDGTLVLINIFFLMFVALTPFSTSLMGRYYLEQLPILVYVINMFLALIMRFALWAYATGKHRLVDNDIDPRLIRNDKIMQLIGALVFCPIVVGVSFLSAVAAYVIMYLGGAFFIVIIIRG